MELIEWPVAHQQSALAREFHAQRARDWWGLWNNGNAVARLLAHFPHPNDERASYVTIFDTQKEGGINHIEEAKTCMYRFIFEFERMRTNPLLDGWFRPVLASPGTAYNHIGALPRIVILPVISEEGGNPVEDIFAIYEQAWQLFKETPGHLEFPHSNNDQRTLRDLVEWLENNFGPLYFPVTKNHFRKWKGDITLSLGKSTIGGWCHLLASKKQKDSFAVMRLRGTSDTNLIATRRPTLDSTIKRVEAFPAITLNIPQNLKLPNHPAIQSLRASIENTWYSTLACMNNTSNSRVHANMTYALAAELLEGYAYSIPVILKQSKGGTAEYEFDLEYEHPVWGELNHPNAVDFADVAFEEAEGQIAINDAFDPYTWSKKSIFQVAGEQNAEPHAVLIQKNQDNKGASFPKRGFLKIANHGNRSIADRKQLLVKRAACLQVIDERLESYADENFEWLQQHNILTRNLENGKHWRLGAKGPMQLIQGPPGTGKTWTSTRLVEDILENNPSARILISSKEHLALDHLVQSIKSSIEGTAFRLARIQSSATQPASGEGLSWQDKSQIYWSSFSNVVGQDASNQLLLNEDGSAKLWTYGAYLDECQILCTTTTDAFLLQNMRREQPLVFDYCIVEEAGKSYISELLGALAFSRNWLLVGDQMQLPPYQIQQARKNYATVINRMMNTNSEKSSKAKDYASKMLIELQKYLAWGSVNQDSVEEYTEKNMNRCFEPFKTYFQYLEQKNGTHFLPQQRRMFLKLSNLISNVFYTTSFLWKKEEEIPLDQLPEFFQRNDRLVFVDTPHASRNKKWKESLNQHHSRQNLAEAKTVISLLEELGTVHDIVVLTPYKGQVELIRSLLPKKMEGIDVHTTDGYQGKEADFILLSMVRNNILSGRSRWGFVTDPHRLNVALSRAREGLIMISSQQHIEESEFPENGNHLLEVLHYIQQHGISIPVEKLGGR